MKKVKTGTRSRKIYFDYAASTPVLKEALQEMGPYFSEKFGNSGSLHSFGQEAVAAVDLARERIARALGLPEDSGFHDVIFASSATEANNLAMRGIVKEFKNKTEKITPRIIVSAIEHESVIETARDLEKNDRVDVVYLGVDERGVVDLKNLENSLSEETILVSVMHASNEIGTIQPLSEISKIIRNFKESKVYSSKLSVGGGYPLLHTDAAQTFNYIDCDPDLLGVDLMTLSSQKMYGPKGAGALYIRGLGGGNKKLISPILTGGSHEFGLRAGTPNVPAIAGFGKAAEIAARDRSKEVKHVLGMSSYFWRELKKVYPKAQLNGCQSLVVSCQLPSILNIYFPGSLASDLLIKLDMAGIAAASGSACSTRSSKPSHVLRALGLPMERVMCSVRFSFGKFTTKEEVDGAIKRIARMVR